MRPSNLMKMFSLTDLLGESDLRKLSFDKLLWNFCSAVSESKSESESTGLPELSFDLFKELVDHRHLRVSSEMDVYQAISDWSVLKLFGGDFFFINLKVKCLVISKMFSNLL